MIWPKTALSLAGPWISAPSTGVHSPIKVCRKTKPKKLSTLQLSNALTDNITKPRLFRRCTQCKYTENVVLGNSQRNLVTNSGADTWCFHICKTTRDCSQQWLLLLRKYKNRLTSQRMYSKRARDFCIRARSASAEHNNSVRAEKKACSLHEKITDFSTNY